MPHVFAGTEFEMYGGAFQPQGPESDIRRRPVGGRR